MKSIQYSLALLIFAILASCSKDDMVLVIDQSLLVGEWNLEDFNYSGSSDFSRGGTSMAASYIGEAYNMDARLILNRDNTYGTEGSYMVELTTTMEGETITENVAATDVENTGTYRIEGNRIITGNSNQLQQPGNLNLTIDEGTIIELTASKLVLIFEHNFASEIQGAQVNITVEGRQVYSR